MEIRSHLQQLYSGKVDSILKELQLCSEHPLNDSEVLIHLPTHFKINCKKKFDGLFSTKLSEFNGYFPHVFVVEDIKIFLVL